MSNSKPGFFQKLFGRSKSSSSSSTAKNQPSNNQHDSSSSDCPPNKSHAYHPPAAIKQQTSVGGSSSPTKLSPPPTSDGPRKTPSPRPTTDRPSRPGHRVSKKKNLKSRKRGKDNNKGLPPSSIDTRRPLEFPATPEMILAYHQAKPFLDKNEEWLMVELNEFECLVDGLEVIKQIAKHSKFFEVEPDELWEEFFEYVEEVPSYDEVINFDVWQEFRDEKYPC